MVYMQNSGEGNAINPIASLLHEKVYAISVIFIIGWRGEPGIHDEPQHIYQGELTLKLLDDMQIAHFVIDPNTTVEDLQTAMNTFQPLIDDEKSVAFVVRKNALTYDQKVAFQNDYAMNREDVIAQIVKVSGDDPIISTTGKASRELFEIRERNKQGHQHDFLTVGSMGHSSSIALGVALQKPHKRIWCIDGDGAILMQMGAMATLGAIKPKNLIHIVINNEAHETVGGMPTVAKDIDFVGIAKACGYPSAVSVCEEITLDEELQKAKQRDCLSFIEIKCSIASRDDLGRPTTTSIENKVAFMGGV